MQVILAYLFGAIMIGYGLILLQGKRIMIPRSLDSLLLSLLLLLNPTIQLMKGGYALPILFTSGVLLIFAYVMTKGKYTITNVNMNMVKVAIIDVLKAKDIKYIEEEKDIILNEYQYTRISLSQSMNSVEINLKDAKALEFYQELHTGLIDKLRKMEDKVFPSTSVFYIALGAILIIIMQYFSRLAG